MKFDFQKVYVGDVYETSSGLSKGRKDFGFGYPFLSFKTVFNNYFLPDELVELANTTEKEREKCSICEGDIFLTRTSETIDELGMSSVALKDYPEATFNGFTKRLRLKEGWNNKVDIKYIAYYFRSPYFRSSITSMSTMTTRASLNIDIINRLPLVLPPLPIQTVIGDILFSIDKKISLNQKINDNLEQQAKTLYKSWFVDFEPFDGYMPESWKCAKLGDIASITSGKRPHMKTAVRSDDAKIPLVGAASIMGYTNTVLYCSPILVTGRVGTHGVVQRFRTPCWTSDNTLVITSKNYEFVYQILQTIDYVNMNRGSTQPLITQTDLKNVDIIFPAVDILDQFESLAGKLMQLWEANRIENEKLAILRDTLLPQLMSGEIDVSKVRI